MKLRYYPSSSHLMEDIFKKVCSEHGGIMQSILASPVRYADALDIKSFTGQMPHYHRVLLHPSLDMQYHLSGYGTFYEEAMIRLVGEAIERYSLMVSQYTLEDKIKYATYREIEKEGRVIPFEYLQIFADSDYAKLNQGQYRGLQRLREDDVVGWTTCASLFRPKEDVWVPTQLLFVGYKLKREEGEVAFCPAFSTGTAAHTSIEHALLNSLLEAIEIDALMINWYTQRQAPLVIVDDLTILNQCAKVFDRGADFDVFALDLTILENVDAHVFGTVLANRKNERPLVVYGAQGHLDNIKGYYRSLMEAVAIAFLGVYGPLYLPDKYFSCPEEDSFTDLDTNVAFFSSPHNAQEKRDLISGMMKGRKLLSSMNSYEMGSLIQNVTRLIHQLALVSEHAVYLDVTPPEAREKGWYVTRTYIPELVTMCVPGVPYSRHPRFDQYGGIRNAYPHPLP